MITIFETLKRMRRLSRPHRIAHLMALFALEKPRSERAKELFAVLEWEMRMQLKAENRMAA